MVVEEICVINDTFKMYVNTYKKYLYFCLNRDIVNLTGRLLLRPADCDNFEKTA